MSPEVFRNAITKMCDRLEKAGIQPIILVGFPLFPEIPQINKMLKSYNSFLLSLAEKRNYRLARADKIYKDNNQINRHDKLVSGEYAYPTFEGHRLLARSVLDSFGYSHLKVPYKLRISQVDGLIKEWKINSSIPSGDKLDKNTVSSLDTSGWKKLNF